MPFMLNNGKSKKPKKGKKAKRPPFTEKLSAQASAAERYAFAAKKLGGK